MLKYRGCLTFQILVRKMNHVDDSKGVQKQEDKEFNPKAKEVGRIGPQLYKAHYDYNKQRS